MKIEFPDDILKNGHLSEQEFKTQLALFLYQKNLFTLETASHFAELDSYQFQKKLSENKIPIHYTFGDFEDDLSVVERLNA